MDSGTSLSSIEEYQRIAKERQELTAYCKKISQGIEELDENSGERAIWELVQNARDVSKPSGCSIKIHLNDEKIVFSHHGMPFDYLSLLALTNQNSSKDKMADTVGQYGTGFMTTHAFNEIVSIDAPFLVKGDGEKGLGYVSLKDFRLDRSKWRNLESAICEMRNEMKLVSEIYKRTPYIENCDDWTNFTYMLEASQIQSISNQLSQVIRLLPFVLVINKNINKVEIEDTTTAKHFVFSKSQNEERISLEGTRDWSHVSNTIVTQELNNGERNKELVNSLQSDNNDDIIILPPYPQACNDVQTIPSIFLWFPLLGTENFGVNFIFHSKRFYPVEKRNNIMLPANTPAKLEKGQINENVLHEMMKALFTYYGNGDNSTTLSREMCNISFARDVEDKVTFKFYNDLQDMWKTEVCNWKVIPTSEGKKAISDPHVRVLHPDFYKDMSEEQREKYEPTIISFVQKVKNLSGNSYLIPKTDTIVWSETVSQWSCSDESGFYITVDDVCKSIKSKSSDLHDFLLFLKDSGNISLLDKYELMPSRNGSLHLKKDMRHGDFMSDQLYQLVSPLMGDDINKMLDISFLDIYNVGGISNIGEYKVEHLRTAIATTIDSWRSDSLGKTIPTSMPEERIKVMMDFSSAFSSNDVNTFRKRMMIQIAAIRKSILNESVLPKLTDPEDALYSRTFKLLLDSIMYEISLKNEEGRTWVKENKDILLSFVQEYVSQKDEDHLNKLDKYGIIPNQLGDLCIRKELHRNAGVPEKMAELFVSVIGKDLHEKWVDVDFEACIPTIEADTPSAIAASIQEEMQEELRLRKPEAHKDDILKIILLFNDKSQKWEEWFDRIKDKKEELTFNIQTASAQESLFSLMAMSEAELKALAKIKEEGNMSSLLETFEQMKEREYNETARFNHLEKIGKHIEDVLREKLGESNISLRVKENAQDELEVDDIQNGQDIIVRIHKPDGSWKDIYYVEVKSKWDFGEPAHMSKNQVKMACKNPDNYALCCVDLRPYKTEDLTAIEAEKVISSTRVKLDIGHQLLPLVDDIVKVDDSSDDNLIKIPDYHSNMSATFFENGEPFIELINKITEVARTTLEQN